MTTPERSKQVLTESTARSVKSNTEYSDIWMVSGANCDGTPRRRKGSYQPPSDPSSSSSSEAEDEGAGTVTAPVKDLLGPQLIDGLPYVRLESDFAGSLCWSNDPRDLALQTYFDPTQPNLAGDFNLAGLRPILRENDGRHRFVLMDDKNRFYVWDEWDGRLFWARDKEIDGLDTLEDKVLFVVGGLGCLEVEPVCRTYHPADDPDLARFRETFPKYRV